MANTFDRRRINGPEESRSPVFDDEKDSLSSNLRVRKFRSPKDIRPICATFSTHLHPHHVHFVFYLVVLTPGLISQANGSAYIETDKTKIACAV